MNEENILKIARLANLSLEPADVQRLIKDLSSIFKYIEQLGEVDVSQVTAMSHVHGSTNVFREDEMTPSLPLEEALQNAPDVSGRFIRVPLVVG